VRPLIETFVAQAALAIERVTLRHEADRAGRVVETERLRTDLLSSVSHDLRTPLASIAGAAGVLLAEEGRIGPPSGASSSRRCSTRATGSPSSSRTCST
jgi:two-component system sensor histidine kinase KdpD